MEVVDWLLLRACEEGDLDIVVKLIQKGVDINVVDRDGRTPLHLASKGGHVEIVEVLIENGAKLDKKDYFNYTPLHYACRNGLEKIVKLFLMWHQMLR